MPQPTLYAEHMTPDIAILAMITEKVDGATLLVPSCHRFLVSRLEFVVHQEYNFKADDSPRVIRNSCTP